MKLEPGTRLSHYGIVELIGRGGMGEVFRATDSRLPREVAIKTSTVQFSDRFALEAKVIASLNHPNICTLFDVGPNYLVMELIDGPTLAERIRGGPLGIDDASDIMRQVADALDYAHERGVVHRDLKPGNIKIRGDGVVKVLDFGLAKVASGPAASASDAATVAAPTAVGVVLGTTAYMSPEQVQGKPVDRRADVWAFGVVFYEMLTGGQMYKGDSTQEVTAAILRDEPDLTKVPPRARRLLKRCLEKDPNKRLRHIGDVMSLLDEAPSGAQSAVAATAPASSNRKWRWLAIAVVAIVSTAVLAMLMLWRHGSGPEAPGFTIVVPPEQGMTFNPGTAMTLSPNGEGMVFQAAGSNGVTQYWVRSSDGKDLRALPGTDLIGANSPPAAWSYDSSSVIFATNTERLLKKVNIRGGNPETIAEWPAGLNGASQNADGVILGGTSIGGTPIYKVVKGSQEAIPITRLESRESNHLFPQFLPDGRHFLYLRVSPDITKAGIYIGDIEAKPEAQSMVALLPTDRQAYYAAVAGSKTGYLVFVRRDTLMAQPFDPASRKLSGQEVVIPDIDRIDSYEERNFGIFSVSDNGMIAYRGDSGQQRVLQWYDEKGNPGKPIGDSALYAFPAISPVDNRIAVAIGSRATRDIFILDERGTPSQFTFNSARDDFPAFSNDGKNIVFSSDRDGRLDLYIGAVDKPGQETLLLHTEEPKDHNQFTRDGRFVLFSNWGLLNRDISAVRLAAEPRKSVPLVAKVGIQVHARVSRDGQWMAYTSGESGALEIWVRPFAPDADQSTLSHWQVSKGGGILPIWGLDNKTIYYYTTQRSQIMRISLDTTNNAVHPGTPQPMFTAPSLTIQFGWDLSPDGKHFLFVADPGGPQTIPFIVLTNWMTRLKK